MGGGLPDTGLSDAGLSGAGLAAPTGPGDRVRLLSAAAELDVVTDVAVGRLAAPDVPWDWLRPLAASRYGAEPSGLLERWLALFGDDVEAVRRARNSVLYGDFITDGNVVAATRIADRVLQLVKDAPHADPPG